MFLHKGLKRTLGQRSTEDTVYLISCFHLIWPAHRHPWQQKHINIKPVAVPFCSASHVFCFCCIFQCAVAASCLRLTTVTWIVTVMATITEPRVVSNAPAATSCRAAAPECVSMGSPGPARKQSVHVSLFFFLFHFALCASMTVLLNRLHFKGCHQEQLQNY